VARLMKDLPTIQHKSQLCLVRVRNIMQGAISLWSIAKFIRQCKRRGFMMNLDFHHANNRVCLPYVDRILEAMGFGLIFRGVVAILHRRPSSSTGSRGPCSSPSQCVRMTP
jgi:hypothetical protein